MRTAQTRNQRARLTNAWKHLQRVLVTERVRAGGERGGREGHAYRERASARASETWPCMFAPQQTRLEFAATQHVCKAPADTCIHLHPVYQHSKNHKKECSRALGSFLRTRMTRTHSVNVWPLPHPIPKRHAHITCLAPTRTGAAA